MSIQSTNQQPILYYCSHDNCPLIAPKHCPCTNAHYCNPEHQELDWPIHKPNCTAKKPPVAPSIDFHVRCKIYNGMLDNLSDQTSMNTLKEICNRGQSIISKLTSTLIDLEKIKNAPSGSVIISEDPDVIQCSKDPKQLEERIAMVQHGIDIAKVKQAVPLSLLQKYFKNRSSATSESN
jgi:hypothetical protein